jgi:glycosyltransferase involved in cell wall biosynthesis
VSSPRKVRVLRLFSRLNIGGPAIHVILATAGLDPNRYESLLVVGREGEREGSFLDLARARGVAPRVISSFGREIRPLRDLATFFRLLALMWRERPDVVHTHTAKAGALGRVAAWLSRVPVVVHTFHGSVFEGYFGRRASRWVVATERLLARGTDAVIAVSPTVARDLAARAVAPEKKIHVIRLGLELEPFGELERYRGQLRAELGLPRSTRLIGSVGRLVPIKDIPTLLRAVPILSGLIPDVLLLLVGDGPDRFNLEQDARQLGIESHVRFLGFRHDLARIYADLDVAVNCSVNEGTPVALIEAMASGVPVVGTRVGGTPDLLEDGRLGRLVAPRDPRALAESLASVLSHPEPARKSALEARRRVQEIFRSDRLLGELDQLYQRLLASKGLLPQPAGPLATAPPGIRSGAVS